MTNRISTARVCGCLLSLACTALAGAPRVSQELFLGDPDEAVDVIVQFKHVPGEESFRKLAARPTHVFSSFRSAALSLSRRNLALLAADPHVEYVTPDRQVHAAAFSGGPDYGWMAAMTFTAISAALPYDGAQPIVLGRKPA